MSGTLRTNDQLDAEARDILRANDRGGFTVPTSGLYPFQWNWDSCLVALGWAAFDEPRAWAEIDSLMSAQWADGMVPHIVFHRPDPGYFPGPERWGTDRTLPTSGITQPPVAASCVLRLLETSGDPGLAEDRARAMLPRLLRYHRWFHTARDPDGSGLVTTVHPWETGMDNSTAWDEALARVQPAADLEPYTRRDTQHVDAAQRPTAAEYDRYMTLVQTFRGAGWDPALVVQRSPFAVADVGTNCILLRADRDLRALCLRLGETGAVAEIEGWIGRAEAAFGQFVEPGTGLWHSIDRRIGGRVPAATSAGFLAFWAGVGDTRLAEALRRWIGSARYAVPSVAADDPRFDALRYWRGPVWLIVNFMIADGLTRAGEHDVAARIERDGTALLHGAGFAEYFDPTNGAGLGGKRFSWTAAMWLAWLSRGAA
jgi:alpha,alpha-trehalase